jgi:AcrR family transcriptional regulator
MAKVVKPRRPYDNSGRQAQTRATRRAVLDAAHSLFIERGYVATTITDINQVSGLPAPTIYRLFGSKMAILSSVLDVAFVGDDEPIAFHERPAVKAALAEPDPRDLLRSFARLCGELLDRSGRLQDVLLSASEVDDDAAELLDRTRSQRHTGQSRVGEALAGRKLLAPGISRAHAADIIYALMSPDLYRVLTVERGWPTDRYERWLAQSLCDALLSREFPRT